MDRPLRTTVIGSYPFPGWLEFAAAHLDQFGPADVAEAQDDAVVAALHDQVAAGLDVVTDGEQTRLDFNLSFYGHLEGLDLEAQPPRRFGPPAHDQRGKHEVTGELAAPHGLGHAGGVGAAARLAPPGPDLKMSVPGPYTLSGRLLPNADYPDRWALTEALLPIVARELELLVAAGCPEITVDEPSMSCYGHREDPERFVDIFNRTVAPVAGRCRGLRRTSASATTRATRSGRAATRRCSPPSTGSDVDELHVEMAGREFSEVEVVGAIAEHADVAVGIVDVKSYYVETPEDIEERVRGLLEHAPAEKLSLAPDCGLSQTARWAAKAKLANMCAGVARVRETL